MPSTDLATRSLIVTLKSPLCGKTNAETETFTVTNTGPSRTGRRSSRAMRRLLYSSNAMAATASWKKPSEAFAKAVYVKGGRGYSEFMFWFCFAYDRKGPCYAWTSETAPQRKAAAIEAMDQELERIVESHSSQVVWGLFSPDSLVLASV